MFTEREYLIWILLLSYQLVLASIESMMGNNIIVVILRAIGVVAMSIFTAYLIYRTVKTLKGMQDNEREDSNGRNS